MRWALIESGLVANVVEQDTQPQIAGTWVECGNAGPGWLYDGVQFSNPAVPAAPGVSAVTMRQARLALRAAGKLAQVDAAIDALPEPQRTDARIEWEYSGEVQRHNGFVSQLAPALNLSEADLDELFEAARLL